GEGVEARRGEGGKGGWGVGDEGLAEQIKRSVHQYRRRSRFAKFVQQPPKERIRLPFHGMDADCRTVKCKSLEAGDGIFQITQRSHEPAICSAVKKFVGALGGNGECKSMELFTML